MPIKLLKATSRVTDKNGLYTESWKLAHSDSRTQAYYPQTGLVEGHVISVNFGK